MSPIKIGRTLNGGLGHSVTSQLGTLFGDLTNSGQKSLPTNL